MIYCDRSSGRSRIGTSITVSKLHKKLIYCDRSSGRSRFGTHYPGMGEKEGRIAIVLRGDRGLEQSLTGLTIAAAKLRSFFGAIEDWNHGDVQFFPTAAHIAIVLRGDRGLEPAGTVFSEKAIELRSFFGAIEDWNSTKLGKFSRTRWIAIVLRGDRGLERTASNQWGKSFLIAIVLRGDRGLEHWPIHRTHHRRPQLRSFFGAIEDWNTRNRTP